eukprot:16336-Pelagomonas_calceolata.AAC.1
MRAASLTFVMTPVQQLLPWGQSSHHMWWNLDDKWKMKNGHELAVNNTSVRKRGGMDTAQP